MTFDATLRSLLESNGISGNRLAAAVGMTPADLHRYRRGVHRPGLEMAQRIATALESLGVRGAAKALLLPGKPTEQTS